MLAATQLDSEEPADAQTGDQALTAMAMPWLPLTPFVMNGMRPDVLSTQSSAATPVDNGAIAGTDGSAIAAASLSSLAKPHTAPVLLEESLEAGFADLQTDVTTESSKADAWSTGLAEAATVAAAASSGMSVAPLATLASAIENLDAGTRPFSGSAGPIDSSAPAAASMPRVAAVPGEATPVSHHIPESVRSARWAESVGNRITLMALSGQQSGSLSLTPEHLGPLEVRINLNQDNATVWFGSQQAETRAALQEALPRLREMFAANGLTLGQADVSAGTLPPGPAGPAAFPGGYAARRSGRIHPCSHCRVRATPGPRPRRYLRLSGRPQASAGFPAPVADRAPRHGP